jgi:carboxylesterase type B
MQKPIIAVSLNYRTMSFGFMASKEVAAAGVSNIGLKDQRLALRWIKENIQAFGGNSSKVTIGGESAGGSSVGYQMVASKGRHDDLFRGAIMESASLLGAAGMSAIINRQAPLIPRSKYSFGAEQGLPRLL